MNLNNISQEFWDSLDFLNNILAQEDISFLSAEIEKSLEINNKKLLDRRIHISGLVYNISFVPIIDRKSTESIIVVFTDVTSEYIQITQLEKEYEECYQKKYNMKLALDHIGMGVWIRDHDGQIRYCNKYYLDLIDNAQVSEGSYKELDKLSKSFSDSCAHDKVDKMSERYLIVHGKRYLYQFNNSYIQESGKIIASCYNVSNKDEIAQDLQRSLAAQSDLLESTSNACAIFGKDRVIKFYNNAFCKLWEIEESWLNNGPKYEHLLDRLRDERKIPEYANYNKFRQEQISSFSNLTEAHNDFYHLPDGKSLKVLIVPHTFGGLLFSYEDITDKIALESSYNTLLDVQKATIENLHEAVCVFSENGRLRLVNSAFVKMWKISDSTLKTSPYIYELLDYSEFLFRKPEELLLHKQTLFNVFSKRLSVTERIELKDGSVISRLIVPLPDGAMLISDIDITDSVVVEKSLREKNMALQEADRIKTEFLANVSYELRSPLTSIVGLSESLIKHLCGKLNSKQIEYVDGIMDSAEQLMVLINDMIDLTAIDAGYVELKVSEFNLYKAANSIIPLVKSRMSSLGLKLILDAEKNITMLGDETRIKQVLFKLLNNAIDRSKKGQEISVEIERLDDNILLIVSDEQTEYLDSSDNKASSGFGKNISISIIKGFVDLHGGNIEFKYKEGLQAICTFPKNNPDLMTMYHSYEEENRKDH
jgi:signal transduction histidine kinase